MNNTIGVISNAPKTIEKIIDIAKAKFSNETTTFTPIVYHHIDEIPQLFLQHKEKIDAWIFSGSNPYNIAEPYMDANDIAVYCPVTGIEIYKYFLETIYRHPDRRLRVSIDVSEFNMKNYQFAIEELHIPKDEIYCYQYPVKFDADAIVEHHLQLWRADKVDTIFTTTHAVYLQLKALNVPVERVEHSSISIRGAIKILAEMLNGSSLKKSQVALVMIEVFDVEKTFTTMNNSYKFQMLNLKIKEQLLNLCQHLNGCYLAAQDNGRYEIFASRGIIEDNIAIIQRTLEEIDLHLHTEMIAGIGFGSTAFSAQSNAYRAVVYGKNHKSVKQVILIDSDGTITECAGNAGREIRYDVFTDDGELLEKLASANVGIKTYKRLVATVNHLNWDSFTSAQLALQLNVTERNIRRILAGLTSSGLITCIGEESLSTRGRPTRKYTLTKI